MESLKEWLGLAALLISVGGVVYNWLTSGGTKALKDVGDLRKATEEKFTKVADDLDERFEKLDRERELRGEAITQRFNLFELQLAKVDEALKHLPDREQSHRLELAIEKLSGRMEAMDQRVSGRIETLDERLKPVSAISDRLQEFLLEQAKR